MSDSYELSQLDPNTFEHLVNHLALHVLGPGLTIFGSGSDGGRDGYFQGEAPYPSKTQRWSGCWYIQSKFHKPHLSKDPQKWLLAQIKEEIKAFKSPEARRKWPDNWIIATNIDPSGVPETGLFDKARELINKEHPELTDNFHIWGGQKILQLLSSYPDVANSYRNFLTPGKVLSEILDSLKDDEAEVKTIIRFLVLSQFDDQKYTKLEQAGSAADTRPGIHDLFIDLPFQCSEYRIHGLVMAWLSKASAKCHSISEDQLDTQEWQTWSKNPSRSRIWFIKGGPGQGKSTIGQFFCQVQRASLILEKTINRIPPKSKTLANEIRKAAEKLNVWPSVPRIPISIELKEFAQWLGKQDENNPSGILTYLSDFISSGVEQRVKVSTLKKILAKRSWLIIFDGLDEVPQDVKDEVALEVCRFVNDIAIDINIDLLTICTSRPQGYSGQFEDLDTPIIELINLSPVEALRCAEPVIALDRSPVEAKKSLQILQSAIESPAVQELMTTPLQSHIMAVVVRDGERPPERKWKLFTNFYQVIKRREANRNLPDKRLAKLLREQDKLLKTVHNRLGFVLHARAESSKGAQTKLERNEFRKIVAQSVSQLAEIDLEMTVETLMQATTNRLVLVSTPDDGDYVRFDVRQLQEFFAAEFIYESVSLEKLRERVELIAGDAHWREVLHFLLSALIENERQTELMIAIEILENLNDGDEESIRILNQRLARGTLPVIRLLQEGVLEQDKRMRQQFRKCLEPSSAFTEVELLQPLMQINQPNSYSWLNNFLISCLQDKSPSEAVGAAIVIIKTLPDDHEKVEWVSNFLLTSSPGYLSWVLRSSMSYREILFERGITKVSKWFLRVVIKIILGTQWMFLTEDAFLLIIKILKKSQQEVFKIISTEFNLCKCELNLFKALLEKEIHPFDHRSGNITSVKKLEFIDIHYIEPVWIKKISRSDIEANLSNSSEIIQLMQLIAIYAKRKDCSSFIKILDFHATKCGHLIDCLLFIMGVMARRTSLLCKNNIVQWWNSIDDTEFQEFQSKSAFCFVLHKRYYQQNKENFQEYLSDLLSNHEDLALQLWMANEDPFLNDKGFEREIVKLVLLKPEMLYGRSSTWGYFLKIAPEHEVDLRSKYLLVSNNPVVNKTSIKYKEFYPFKLNLPEEALLLPHLVDALISSLREVHRGKEIDKDFRDVRQNVIEMVDDVSQLRTISDDLNAPTKIRAAATILLLLHPDGGESFENRKKFLVEFYQSNQDTWYIKAVAACLYLLTTEEDFNAKWILSKLLDVTRTNYEARSHFSNLLALWRERSFAPIQKADVQERWLIES